MSERQTYRPNRTFSLTMASVFVGTAGVLAWMGAVLSQADLEAMDGFQRAFFSVVPIRPFSWVFAGVFAFLGVRLGIRGWRARASLVISEGGFSVGTGELQPWSRLQSATNPKGDHLVLQLLPPGTSGSGDEGQAPPGPGSKPRSTRVTRVTLSQFDLGDHPKAVAEAIERIRKSDQP